MKSTPHDHRPVCLPLLVLVGFLSPVPFLLSLSLSLPFTLLGILVSFSLCRAPLFSLFLKGCLLCLSPPFPSLPFFMSLFFSSVLVVGFQTSNPSLSLSRPPVSLSLRFQVSHQVGRKSCCQFVPKSGIYSLIGFDATGLAREP